MWNDIQACRDAVDRAGAVSITVATTSSTALVQSNHTRSLDLKPLGMPVLLLLLLLLLSCTLTPCFALFSSSYPSFCYPSTTRCCILHPAALCLVLHYDILPRMCISFRSTAGTVLTATLNGPLPTQPAPSSKFASQSPAYPSSLPAGVRARRKTLLVTCLVLFRLFGYFLPTASL